MDLVGIGILLIGIAILIIAIFLARILKNLASILSGVDKTVELLPKQLDTLMNETGELLHNTNNTLADVNEKLGTLTPIFHIVGDVGESTRKFSSALVDVTKTGSKKLDAADTTNQNKKLGGIYGSTALGYYLFGKRKGLKKSKLFVEGEKRSNEIIDMNAAATNDVKI
ncbi:DUF948 domain-containing protein [Sporosarcina sp. CAU 1771]